MKKKQIMIAIKRQLLKHFGVKTPNIFSIHTCAVEALLSDSQQSLVNQKKVL